MTSKYQNSQNAAATTSALVSNTSVASNNISPPLVKQSMTSSKIPLPQTAGKRRASDGLNNEADGDHSDSNNNFMAPADATAGPAYSEEQAYTITTHQ